MASFRRVFREVVKERGRDLFWRWQGSKAQLAKAPIGAVAGEAELFTNCFTVSTLVEKLEQEFCTK